MTSINRRRVAITGMGVATPVGSTLEKFWEGLNADHDDPTPWEVTDLDPEPLLGRKAVRRSDKNSWMTMHCCAQALTMAGVDLELVDRSRCGVVMGNANGGQYRREEQFIDWQARGDRSASPFYWNLTLPSAGGAMVSIEYGFSGPSTTVSAACAAGSHGLVEGFRNIAYGFADLVLAGGCEASVSPIVKASFVNLGVLSASGKNRPFDVERDGFVLTESAAMLVLEPLEAAVERGATILAELLGGSITTDASHFTTPEGHGAAVEHSHLTALDDAGLQPTDIGHVNPHGTGTPQNDLVESLAIERIYGSQTPVTSAKGAVGHSAAGSGAVEAVASILAMQHKVIPPIVGLRNPDPALNIDLVFGVARPWEPGPVASSSFGLGGHHACVILAPPPVS